MDTEELARRIKVLSVGTRLRIVELLKDRILCVNALAARLEVTQGAVSQHLRILREARLVLDEKRGYHVHYRLNEEAIAAWRKAMDRLLDLGVGVSQDAEGVSRCAAAKTRSKKAVRSQRT